MKPNRFILLLALLTLVGCSNSKRLVVIDEQGAPITGAGITPYPIIPFSKGNKTDSSGIIYAYDIGEESYLVSASGYQTRELSFAQLASGRVVLYPKSESSNHDL